jgi:hypothetical protein
VFERAPGLHMRGAGVGLNPNGTAALRAIDPELAERVAATSLKRLTVLVEDMKVRPQSQGTGLTAFDCAAGIAFL